MNQHHNNSVVINIGGQMTAGQFPLVPVRFLLQTRRRDAFGFVAEDFEHLAEGEQPEPSNKADNYALQRVYDAAVGLCHPSPQWPSLRECRHDVVLYGEGVSDHYMRAHKDAAVLQQLYDEGRRLLEEMAAEINRAMVDDVEQEKDFSGSQEDPSTSS